MAKATKSGLGRKCLFCDLIADSREHVIPEWLSKRMGIRRLGFHPAYFSENGDFVVRPTIKSEHFKTRIVCSRCNSGWMSELENWFKSKLGNTVEPRWAPADLTEIETVRADVDSLIRWLLKTAIAFEQAAPRASLDHVNPILYPIAKGDISPQHFHVWAGYILERNFSVYLRRGFPVWNGGVLQPYQIHDESIDFGLQLNHLGLRLIRCPEATAGLKLGTVREDGHFAAPLSLTVSTPYPFPHTHHFPTFSSFADVLEVHAKPPTSK